MLRRKNKMNFKLFIPVLIFALLSTSVMAAPNLPTKQEIITFVDSVPTDNGKFIQIASNMSKTEHPNWNWDIWSTNSTKMISFYYNNSSSEKGYSSLYYDESGKYLNHLCYINLTLVESFPVNNSTINLTTDSKPTILENKTNDNTSCNITNNSVENVTAQTNNTTEAKFNNVTSSIDINVNNYTSGTSANLNVKSNSPISTNQIDEFVESIRHLLNAIFGGN
jgi:hypothetical protein